MKKIVNIMLVYTSCSLQSALTPLETDTQRLNMVQEGWNQEHGVKRLQYRGDLMLLNLRRHMTTTICLPLWERISHANLGDDSVLSIISLTQNRILLDPKNMVMVDTNVTLIGESGYVYSFYVVIYGVDDPILPDIKVVVKALKPKDYLIPKAQSTLSFNPAHLDFNYSMRGSRRIAPSRVYSDGRRIWLEWAKEPYQFPVVMGVEQGVDTVVNTGVDGPRLWVDFQGNLSLTHGFDQVCIFKDGS